MKFIVFGNFLELKNAQTQVAVAHIISRSMELIKKVSRKENSNESNMGANKYKENTNPSSQAAVSDIESSKSCCRLQHLLCPWMLPVP